MRLIGLLYLTSVLCDYSKMAGYSPVSNVITHSKIDLDLRDLKAQLDVYDFSEAENVYSNGGNSVKSSGSICFKSGYVSK